MKSPLLVLVLLLAACSSSAPKAAPTSTLAPNPTTPGTLPLPAGSGGSGCTQADLDGPVLPMPPPRSVTTRVVLKSGERFGARLEPAPNATPTVSGADAWQTMTKLDPVRARRGELMFGRFRASIPFGPRGSQKLNLLAWVLQLHHLAYPYPPGQVQVGVCLFRDAYLVIDATTGYRVVNSY